MANERALSRHRRIAAVVVSAALLSGLGGCQDRESNTDLVYLTGLSNDEGAGASPSPKPGEGPLVPTVPGSRWTMRVRKSAAPNAPIIEQIVASGARSVSGAPGVVLETRRNNRLFWREVYAPSSSQGVQIRAFGRGLETTAVPAIPVIRYPVVAGNTCSWTGRLLEAKTQRDASSYSRVSALETVTVPAGRFQAYRVDMLLSVFGSNGRTQFPSTCWFAPGIGIVKNLYLEKGRPVIKELIAYDVKKESDVLTF